MVKRIVSFLLALAGTFLVFYLSLRGAGGYSSFGNDVGTWINETVFQSKLTTEEVSALTHFGGKGFGHVLLYLVTGISYDVFLSTFRTSKKEKAILLGIGILLASAGELTQLFTPSRNPSFADVVINFSSFAFVPMTRRLLKSGNQ